MSARVSRTVRLWLSRIVLLVFGLLVGLGVVETLLQLGARLRPARTAIEKVEQRLAGVVRILALGDSNTYGLWVAREAAYLHVAEQLWNGQKRRPRLQVFNLGYPGTNSSQVLSSFDRYLASFRPDMVTLMVGANDAWTVPVPAQAGRDRDTTWQQWFWAHSRLYRMLYMLWRARENARPEVTMLSDPFDVQRGSGVARFRGREFALGHQKAEHPQADWMARAEANLRAIVESARRWSIPIVLLTYPSGHFIYGAANEILRKVAQETATPLVDITGKVEEACPEWRCDELFPDQHPTAKGHRRIAEALVAFLEENLAAGAAR